MRALVSSNVDVSARATSMRAPVRRWKRIARNAAIAATLLLVADAHPRNLPPAANAGSLSPGRNIYQSGHRRNRYQR
jgi:hypothetical protein